MTPYTFVCNSAAHLEVFSVPYRFCGFWVHTATPRGSRQKNGPKCAGSLHIEADHTRAAGIIENSRALGKGNIMGCFNDTMTDATTQARALLLALLRDSRPGDEPTLRWWRRWLLTCGWTRTMAR